jgi:hypothetical protein
VASHSSSRLLNLARSELDPGQGILSREEHRVNGDEAPRPILPHVSDLARPAGGRSDSRICHADRVVHGRKTAD